MLVIGLTGGIGSGKTTVASGFAKLGVPIIDADLISHELTQVNMAATAAIAEHYGPSILKEDGSLNRQQLRQLVFDKPEERQWLEQLLHPLIRREIENRLGKIQQPYCIVVIPLLIETGPYTFIDRIAVVDLSEEQQLARLTARDKAKAAELKKIIRTQVDRETRRASASDLIINEGQLADLEEQIQHLHQLYSSLSQTK